MNATSNTFTSNTVYGTTRTGQPFSFTWNVYLPPPDDGLAGCFAVLGVPPNSPPDVLRKAYRAKLHETHPDHGGSDEAVRRVVEAYRQAVA